MLLRHGRVRLGQCVQSRAPLAMRYRDAWLGYSAGGISWDREKTFLPSVTCPVRPAANDLSMSGARARVLL